LHPVGSLSEMGQIDENCLLMIAHYGTASHVERLVKNYRSVRRNEALEKVQQQHLQRELQDVPAEAV